MDDVVVVTGVRSLGLAWSKLSTEYLENFKNDTNS